MSHQFWLDSFPELINFKNFNLSNTSGYEKNIQLLNCIAMITIVVCLYLSFKKKKSYYIPFAILILSITIFIRSNVLKTASSFKSKFGDNTATNAAVTTNPMNTQLTNAYNTGVYLVRAVDLKSSPNGLNNSLYVNQSVNFKKGDIIALSVNGSIIETNIISDIQYTTDGTNTPVIILLNPLKNNYSKYTTSIMKVSDSTPNLTIPPNPNSTISQNNQGNVSDPMVMAVQNYPGSSLPNTNRYDWNLELSTYGGLEPGQPPNYEYQGQPFGPLKCRTSTVENPMGSINVTEYDAAPTMYGTCNIGEDDNNNKMTINEEATVSQRVDDLLFHKGNGQTIFTPMPIDTLPNDQEAFGHFCYRNPTNLVNVKYGSIFVNEPEKYKLVSRLARATGTENGL